MILKTVSFLSVIIYFQFGNAVKDRYYPRYHLAPPYGWMNDPNGFSIYRGEYHLFYQFNPNSSLEPGIAHWGHAKSKDLFHWEHLPIAMYPDEDFDIGGVFSGSAIVHNDTLYLMYTGNVNLPDQKPDHQQVQALAYSTDAVNVTKLSDPIIFGKDLQPNFRDPKVWEDEGTFYAVLGNSYENDTLGRALLFSSPDLISWKQVSVLDYSDGSLGWMWECPDFFELDGHYVLLFSPLGMKPQGDKYKNLFQTGYIIGDFNYETYEFQPLTEFRELDHGHDFYATQTILDDKKRRVLIAWMDMWGENYPERADGWTGHMTVPRQLSLSHNLILIQKPVTEVNTLRAKTLYSGRVRRRTEIELEDNAGEINIKASRNRHLKVYLESKNTSSTLLIHYNPIQRRLTLDRGGKDGERRTKWKPKQKEFKMKIFVDASSVEVFCDEGEITFSSRFFPEGPVKVRVDQNNDLKELRVISLMRSLPKPE